MDRDDISSAVRADPAVHAGRTRSVHGESGRHPGGVLPQPQRFGSGRLPVDVRRGGPVGAVAGRPVRARRSRCAGTAGGAHPPGTRTGGGTGITGYAADAAVESAVFSLSGKLWRVDLRSGAVTAVPVAGAAIDPRLSGDGTAIAYVSGGALRVGDGDGDRALAEPEAPLVGYGLPEHVAAESMHRMRGYWWAPDGRRLVVARVDVSPVQVWYLADPAGTHHPAVRGAARRRAPAYRRTAVPRHPRARRGDRRDADTRSPVPEDRHGGRGRQWFENVDVRAPGIHGCHQNASS